MYLKPGWTGSFAEARKEAAGPGNKGSECPRAMLGQKEAQMSRWVWREPGLGERAREACGREVTALEFSGQARRCGDCWAGGGQPGLSA